MATSPSPLRVAVIGGGMIGASTAYFLTERGAECTLVEGSSIAAGSSGKSGGLLALDWHGAETSSLAELSYGLHAQLAQEHGGEQRWGYRNLTTLSITADISPARKANAPPANESATSWLDRSVVSRSSTLGTPKTTSQVHPRLMTQSLVDIARAKGLKVVYGTVDSLSQQGRAYKLGGVERDGGGSLDLPAFDKVVVAAGPWTGELVRSLGRSLSLKSGRALSIRGSRAHSAVISPPAGKSLPAQALFTMIKQGSNSHEPEIYNRPAASSGVDGVDGTTAYACGPTDGCPLPKHASDVTVDDKAIDAILKQVGALSPEYLDTESGGAQCVARQACYLPVGSGDPVIGAVGEGIYVASGHSCWGICNGPGTGLVVSELVLDGAVASADISGLSP